MYKVIFCWHLWDLLEVWCGGCRVCVDDILVLHGYFDVIWMIYSSEVGDILIMRERNFRTTKTS